MKDYSKILFPYAYNILGSAEDAQDVVQDVLTKHFLDAREGIENEKAYLIRSVINLSVNRKIRRKPAVQPEVWLPEPVATERADANVYLKDILSYSLLVLLEKLNAKERAVFILKESFDYRHDEIAGILGISEEHSRKLLSRAKARLFKPSETPDVSARSERTNALLQNYIDAIRGRDMAKLEGLLAEDVAFFADGGKLNVVRKMSTGFTEVAGVLVYVFHTYHAHSDIRFTEINHQPAFLFYDNGRLASCQVFDISPETGRIVQVNSIVDPDKLTRIAL